MTQTAELLPPAEPAPEPATTIAEYSHTAAALAGLKQRMQGLVYDVSTAKGLEVARKDRAEIRAYRIALENKRVEIKAPALKRAREIDSEATRIRLELEKLEAIPDAAIRAEEQRKEAEKQARIAAEVARVGAIQQRIAELRGNQLLTPADGSTLIGQHIADLQAIVIDESFGEFIEQAQSTKFGTLERLNKLLAAAQAHEAQQEQLRIEREEIARQRAQQEEANRKERERIAAEEAEARAKREAEEANLRAERELDKKRRTGIAAIQQLAVIAMRAANREVIVECLSLARAAECTMDIYGGLVGEAISARESTVNEILDLRARFDERAAEQARQRELEAQRQADEQRLAAERAALEAQRREQEAAAQAERDAIAERERKLQADREQLEVLQAALAPVAQVSKATEPEAAPDVSTSDPQSVMVAGAPVYPTETNGWRPEPTAEFVPTRTQLIACVSIEFGQTMQLAEQWLVNEFGGSV